MALGRLRCVHDVGRKLSDGRRIRATLEEQHFTAAVLAQSRRQNAACRTAAHHEDINHPAGSFGSGVALLIVVR
jgi:hypothetical protein